MNLIGIIKPIGYFIRGLWREFVCLVVKVVAAYTTLNTKQRFAFWWTFLGAVIPMVLISALIYQEAIGLLQVQDGRYVNADYYAMVFISVISCGIVGAIAVWVMPVFVYAIYLSIKHTVNVGKA